MSEQPPRVVIGIVTRNRAALLLKALESALAQSHSTKQVVVLDDASTDTTPDIAARFPDVLWIRNEHPAGCIASRNRIMADANGKYFCSLDDDAWFLTDNAIAEAVRAMETSPDVAAVAFHILSRIRPTPAARSAPVPIDTFTGCGHMLRLDAVRAIGGYAPLPGPYGGEEKDLCLRFLDRGWNVILLPGVHVWHEKTALHRDIPRQHASGVCNDLAIALLRFPAASLWWRLPAKIASHLRFAIRNRLLGPCLAGLRAFASAAPGLLPGRAPVSPTALKQILDPARRTGVKFAAQLAPIKSDQETP